MPAQHPDSTLGVRNNNPGNIERNNIRWQGAATEQSGRFIKFVSPEWGIRAMARVLITYQDKHKCDTVVKIISRWAPADPVMKADGTMAPENHTDAYIRVVTEGVFGRYDTASANTRIDVYNYQTMFDLMTAMIKVECAGKVYPRDVMDEGLKLAGIVPTDNQMEPSKRGRLLTIASAGTAVTAAGDILVEASTHVDTARSIMSLWEYGRWIVVALTMAGIIGALIRHMSKKHQLSGDATGRAVQPPDPSSTQASDRVIPPATAATGPVTRA